MKNAFYVKPKSLEKKQNLKKCFNVFYKGDNNGVKSVKSDLSKCY